MTEVTAFDYVTQHLDINQEDGEGDNAYLQRVAFELQNLNDAEWQKLPESLQDWYNKTADIIAGASETDEEPEIPALPAGKVKKVKKVKKIEKVEIEEEIETVEEEAEEEEAEEEEAEEEEAEEETPKKRGRKPKEEKAPRVKKEKVEKTPRVKKEKVEKEPRGPTAAQAVREILCENMDLSLDEVMKELEKRGVTMKRSSCQVVTLNTVSAFEVAVQIGQVKDNTGKVVLST